MLARQKALLALLLYASRPLTRLELVKLAFLLRQEPATAAVQAFYDFVPYRFGPFSFALYREMEALAQYGYVEWCEERVSLLPALAAAVREAVESLPERARSAAGSIVSEFAGLGQTELMKNVYRRYPWYAIKSEVRELLPENLPPPVVARPAVYTAGYEGKSVDLFFNDLLRTGIAAVVDVRANPVSRKYGFAGKSLSGIASRLGLEYAHEPKVGIPSDKRRGIDGPTALGQLLDYYGREILPKEKEAVDRIARLLRQKPAVLVCAEKEAYKCHRSRLASAMSRTTGLPVVDL